MQKKTRHFNYVESAIRYAKNKLFLKWVHAIPILFGGER